VWNGHRLAVEIDSERFEYDADDTPAWIATHQNFTEDTTTGRIRIGSWNNSADGMSPSIADSRFRLSGPDDAVTISNVPSTSYIRVGQQVQAGRARIGTGASNPANDVNTSAANATTINNAINARHERDFADSYTDNVYLWPSLTEHTTQNLTEDATISHNTNWANPLPTDNNPLYTPAREMDNAGRDFDFRVTPRAGSTITVVNYVDGAGADMDRNRLFRVEFRAPASPGSTTMVPASPRTIMLWTGETEEVQVGTDPDTLEPIYEIQRVLHPVNIDASGHVESPLMSLGHGESFELMRVGNLYEARVVMLPFPTDDDLYDVINHYVREREAIPSIEHDGMASPRTAFNRDNLEVTFESYAEEIPIIPTGLLVGGGAAFSIILAVTGIGAAAFVAKRRMELEALAPAALSTSPRAASTTVERLVPTLNRAIDAKDKFVRSSRQLSIIATKGIWRKK
jgi:hypothetical protein